MKEEVISIEELQQDDHNFNKGTEEGGKLMKDSFSELGAGRSILIDKNGRIIAGNKSQKAAIEAGIKKVRVIETTGDELVAVKRTDVDLDTALGRKLALADNLTTQVNLAWDQAEMATVQDEIAGFDPEDFGFEYDDIDEAAQMYDDDQFEQDFNSIKNQDAVYPLIPKYDEKHELFVIVSSNEVDSNYLREILNMQKMKSYKTGKLIKSNVVDIKDVIHELENRNTKSQALGPSALEKAGD